MLNRYLAIGGFGILFSLLAGCADWNRFPVVQEPAMSVVNTSNSAHALCFNRFQHIVIQGEQVHVLINGHRFRNTLQVTASDTRWQHFSAKVKNDTLYINAGNDFIKPDSTPVDVVIDLAQPLQSLTDSGSGELTTKNMAEQALHLELGGQVNAHMTGNQLVFQQIDVSDQALLYAYWVDSSHLQVNVSDAGKVFLGGVVTHLDIQAKDNANVDMRYLQVKEAFVKTQGNANVGFKAENASTWALGHSTIYQYADPSFGAHTLADAGSVLRMQGIPVNRNALPASVS